jgi:hypothetical protein
VVAITHNQAFATALQPTHVLRVAGGSAKLSEHSGSLSAKDFEHSTPSSSSSSSNVNGNGKAAASSNGNGKVAANGSSSAGKKVGVVGHYGSACLLGRDGAVQWACRELHLYSRWCQLHATAQWHVSGVLHVGVQALVHSMHDATAMLFHP